MSSKWLTEQGLTSHQTHYWSYQGWVFTGQTTRPTVSKHWRKIGPKDQASIPSGPSHHAHNNTTTMQYETKTHKIHTEVFQETITFRQSISPRHTHCIHCNHQELQRKIPALTMTSLRQPGSSNTKHLLNLMPLWHFFATLVPNINVIT